VENPEAGADGCLAVMERVPGETNSGLEVLAGGVVGPKAVPKYRGRVEGGTGRIGRSRHGQARQRRSGRRHDGNPAVLLGWNTGVLVTQSQVQSQVGTNAPIVLDVSGDNLVAKILLANGG